MSYILHTNIFLRISSWNTFLGSSLLDLHVLIWVFTTVSSEQHGERVGLWCYSSLWMGERQLVLVYNILSAQMLFAVARIPLFVVTDVCSHGRRLYFFNAFLTGFFVYRAQAYWPHLILAHKKADMQLKHCLDELQDLGCGLCFDRWFGVKAYILALFPKDVSASQGSCEVSVPLTPWCW